MRTRGAVQTSGVMRIRVRKFGTSSAVVIPTAILARIGIAPGDSIDLSLDGGRIVLVPAKRHPRAGWAEAARRVAEADDDTLVWPEFRNARDANLKW